CLMPRGGPVKKLISPRRGFCAHRRNRKKRRQQQRETARQEGVKPQDHGPVINRGRSSWEARRIWQLKKKGASKMALKVHALMQDAQDFHIALIATPEEDHMAIAGITHQPIADI